MEKTLAPVQRYLTGNDATGASVFLSDNVSPPQRDMSGMRVSFCFGTSRFPVSLAGNEDLLDYQNLIDNPPGIIIPNGCVFRMVDFPPGYTSPMHRTMSVNFNTVIEGEMEVLMDSGASRVLKRGDSIVQRAINHSWRNPSTVHWARISAIAFPAEPFVVGEKTLEPSSSL